MFRSVLVGHLGGCLRRCLNGNVKMITTQWPHRVRRRFALAVALVVSASGMTSQASDPNQIDGFSELPTTEKPVHWSAGETTEPGRRLPDVSEAFSFDAPANQNFSGAKSARTTWKTKMAFERLELRAANDMGDRQSTGALQKCSAESEVAATGLNGGVTTMSRGDGVDVRWLRSSSASDCAKRARNLIDRGSIEYGSGAWLSAEATVWEAFRCAAEGIDLHQREIAKAQLGIRRRSATGRLQFARTAIREARDFAGVYGTADGRVISRMAISHSTDVLDGMSCDTLSGSDAADRYLDAARVALSEIASQSVEAAQGMDLLAAIYLKQDQPSKLHNATALCLRRAALQGQPVNSSLASRLGMHLLDVGLLEEARWALSHSLSIEKDDATIQAYIAVLQQTGRKAEAQQVIATLQPAPASIVKAKQVPAITELSPQDFAAISKPVMPASVRGKSEITTASVRRSVPSRSQSGVTQDELRASPAYVPEDGRATDAKPNIFKRFAESVKNLW